MPPGLIGMLAKVPLYRGSAGKRGHLSRRDDRACHDRCRRGSRPVVRARGRQARPVYLTGPYNGGPFGLSRRRAPKRGRSTSAQRGRPAEVACRDQSTRSQRRSPSQDPLPKILKGVPLDIRSVNVTVNRSGFMFNPTSCEKMPITGRSKRRERHDRVGVRSRSPTARPRVQTTVKVSTSGKTSRKNGASLHVKLAYPKARSGAKRTSRR